MPTSRFHGGRREMSSAADQDASAIGLGEPGDEAEEGGLAAAGRTQESEELARRDVEIDVLQDVMLPVTEVYVLDADGDGLAHDLGCATGVLQGHGCSPRSRCPRSMTTCDTSVQTATSATAMTPRAAPGPRPAADCMNT